MSNLDSPSQESHLTFLKTVVNQETNQDQPVRNGTDSDKENENKDFVTSSFSSTTKEYNFSLSEETTTTQKSPQTMSKGDSDMWDDFYNEEDFVSKKEVGEQNQIDDLRLDRRLDKVEEEEEYDYTEEDSNPTESHSKENGGADKSGEDISDKNTNSSSGVKKRKKRLFKRRAPPPLSPKSRTLLPIGGSHPNIHHDTNNNRHHRNDSLSSTDQNGSLLETMSDTTSGRDRKLLRRKQVSRPRCAGPKPNGDRLQQKYQELEHLMLKPLPNPAVYVQQTRQQMLRLQGLNGGGTGTAPHPSQHHHAHQHHNPVGLPPTGQHPAPRDADMTDRVIQVIDEDTNQVYSTMMTVNANRKNKMNNRVTRPNSAHPRRRPLSAQNKQQHPRQQRLRPQSAGAGQASGSSEPINSSSSLLGNSSVNGNSRVSRGRKPVSRELGRNGRNVRSDSSRSASGGRRSDRSESGSKDRERDYGSSSFEDGSDSRSTSRSPGRIQIQTTDNHLKNSANPALRQWLKVKDKEYRQQKREERKKKSRERAEKQEEELRKEESLKKAEEKVKEWMTQKRKEAWKHAKEERKRKKEEDREIEQQIKHSESLRGKMFTPIKRPAGKYENDNTNSADQHQQNNAQPTTPQPPKSKFVYKRPVSGRVRLMKLQQERKEDTKKLEEKKKEMDEQLARDKEKKMRMSYDQWLLKKREDDYTKRREAAKQRALAKSDPELDRILPEMAKRRIENIKRGKKRIDTGDNSIDKSVNKSFGGGDFAESEGEGGENSRPPSYRLEVSGDKKSLKQRPSSAKTTTTSFNPKLSRSPRRPQSANPRVQALMEKSDDGSSSSLNPDNSFKLPFPPEFGVPKHVAARQEKLFSGQVIEAAKSNASSMKDGLNEESNQQEALGVEGNNNNVSNDNSSAEVNRGHNGSKGTDTVDAEQGDCEPQLKSVADTIIASNMEEGKARAANENDEASSSFFVTHGNLKKTDTDDGGNDVTKGETKPEVDGSFGNNDENLDVKIENVVDGGEEDIISSLKNDELAKPESDNDNDGGFEMTFGEDDEKEAAVPPLDIGNDDDGGNQMKYEEEEGDIGRTDDEKAEDENIQDGKRAALAEESSSDLLDKVEDVSDSVEMRRSSIIKHVSFSEETTIHEDPLAGLCNDDYGDDYDADFYDENGRHDNNMNGINDGDGDNDNVPSRYFDEVEYDENLDDEIEGYQENDDEAEDERGDYF